jgi:hypothetical protein
VCECHVCEVCGRTMQAAHNHRSSIPQVRRQVERQFTRVPHPHAHVRTHRSPHSASGQQQEERGRSDEEDCNAASQRDSRRQRAPARRHATRAAATEKHAPIGRVWSRALTRCNHQYLHSHKLALLLTCPAIIRCNSHNLHSFHCVDSSSTHTNLRCSSRAQLSSGATATTSTRFTVSILHPLTQTCVAPRHTLPFNFMPTLTTHACVWRSEYARLNVQTYIIRSKSLAHSTRFSVLVFCHTQRSLTKSCHQPLRSLVAADPRASWEVLPMRRLASIPSTSSRSRTRHRLRLRLHGQRTRRAARRLSTLLCATPSRPASLFARSRRT